MTKPKLLHIIEPFAAGTLSFLVDLVSLQIKDYDIYIIWGKRPLTPSNVNQLFPKEVHLYKMKSFKGALGSVLNPASYIEIKKLYNKIEPDIVHLHSSAAGFVGRWGLPVRKKKVFYTPHGFSFLRQDIPYLARKLYKIIEYVTAFRSATIIGCGESELIEIKNFPCNITFVNNGIPLHCLNLPVCSNLYSPIVAITGRISPQKNPSLFNRIALLLPNVHFVWIGDGDKEERKKLSATNIRITGWLKREDALTELSRASFFLLPSLWEGLPFSLLEAMYLKRVCLTSDIAAFQYIIRDKENGFLCHTAENFADQIVRCLEGKFNLDQITETAHQEIKNKYNIEVMASQYNAIYKGERNK